MALASRIRGEMADELPERIHIHAIAGDGAPEFDPDFMRFISRGSIYRGQRPTRRDATRAFVALRTLRKESRREYEVAYRMLVHGWTLDQVASWLSRSRRDAEVMAACALGKIDAWITISQV